MFVAQRFFGLNTGNSLKEEDSLSATSFFSYKNCSAVAMKIITTLGSLYTTAKENGIKSLISRSDSFPKARADSNHLKKGDPIPPRVEKIIRRFLRKFIPERTLSKIQFCYIDNDSAACSGSLTPFQGRTYQARIYVPKEYIHGIQNKKNGLNIVVKNYNKPFVYPKIYAWKAAMLHEVGHLLANDCIEGRNKDQSIRLIVDSIISILAQTIVQLSTYSPHSSTWKCLISGALAGIVSFFLTDALIGTFLNHKRELKADAFAVQTPELAEERIYEHGLTVRINALLIENKNLSRFFFTLIDWFTELFCSTHPSHQRRIDCIQQIQPSARSFEQLSKERGFKI